MLVAALLVPGSIIAYLTLRTISQEELLSQQRIQRRCQAAAEVVLGGVDGLIAALDDELAEIVARVDPADLEAELAAAAAGNPLASVAFIVTPGRPPRIPGFAEPQPSPRDPMPALPKSELDLYDELTLQGEGLIATDQAQQAAELFEAVAQGYSDHPEMAARALSAAARGWVAAGELDRALEVYLAIAGETLVVRGPDMMPVSALAALRAAELYARRDEPDAALDVLADLIVELAWDSLHNEYGADWLDVIEERATTLATQCDEDASAAARDRIDACWAFFRFMRPFTLEMARDLEARLLDGSAAAQGVHLGRVVGRTPVSVTAVPVNDEADKVGLAGFAIDVERIRAYILSDAVEGELANSWGCVARLVDAGGLTARPPVEGDVGGDSRRSEKAWYESGLGAGLGFWRLQVYPLDVEELELGRRRALWLQMGVVFTLVVLVGVVVIVTLRGLNREVALARLKSEFVSSVSHELKTPLTAIRMLGEMLQAGDVPPDKQTRYQETIVRESLRLTRLIDNILDFDRLERGRREFTFQPVSVDGVVAEAVETARLEASRDGLSFRIRLEPDLPAITADRDALAQVLLNLLSNAVKYSPGGGVIEVRARRRGGRLLLEVEDHGAGIEPAERERIFERFHRAAGSRRDAPGAGLGLAIARLIAQAHDGYLGVESTPGQGSTFTLSLPLKMEIADVDKDHPRGRRRARHPAGSRGSSK